jgi:hypothetical protein
MVVCNVVVYNSVGVLLVVSLLVVRELMTAITGSPVGSPIDFGAIFGNLSWRRKLKTVFLQGGKGSPTLLL